MSQEKRSFYEVLQIDENASKQEAHTAYLKLALQYHPDRNRNISAVEKFKEISQAYREALLVLPEKKRNQPSRPLNPFPSMNLRGTITYHLTVSPREAETGTTRSIQLTTIEQYDGELREQRERFKLVIPNGVKTGTGLRFRLTTDTSETDLIAYITIQSHPEDSSVYYEIPVHLRDFDREQVVTVQTIEGPIQLPIPPNIKPDTILLVRGKGLQEMNGERGDLLVKILE